MYSINFTEIINMDQIHLHHFVSYWPLVCLALGIFIFLFAMIFKDLLTKIKAYVLFMISVLMALVVYQTEKGAENAGKSILGITNKIIEQHEEFSIYPWIAFIVLGVATVIGIIRLCIDEIEQGGSKEKG